MADPARAAVRAAAVAPALALAALALLAGSRAHALELPIRADSSDGRVTVLAEQGLERRAERLARAAPGRLADIEADLVGLPRAGRIEVRLVKHAQDLAAAAPPGGGAPPWAAGVAWPQTGTLALAVRARDGSLVDLDSTFAHELAHLALGRALDRPVPRWLTEGFAFRHSSDFSLARAWTLAGALLGGHLIPIGALDDSFPPGADEAALAYAEAYDFVTFLARRGRWPEMRTHEDRGEAFRELLAGLAAGRSLDAAAQAAFGRPIGGLELEWLESLRTRYLWYPIGASASLVWVLGALLLCAGWVRRKVQTRRRLRQWAIEEGGEPQGRA